MVKNLPAKEGDAGSILGSGRSPGEGNGNSLQYSCLGNPMDGRAWRATVHEVTKSQTQLKQLSMHTCKTALPNTKTGHIVMASVNMVVERK